VGTDNLSERYTMQHEREIHERTIEGAEDTVDVPSTPLVMAEGNGEDGNDHGTNVALFPDVTGDGEEEPGNNLELSGKEAGSGKEDLGDNVELF